MFAFGGPGLLAELVEATVPAGGMLPVRRSFASGDNVIAVEQLVQRFAPPEPESTPVPENRPAAARDRGSPPAGRQRPRRCKVPPRAGGTATVGVGQRARRSRRRAASRSPLHPQVRAPKKVRKGRVISLSRKAGASVPIDAASHDQGSAQAAGPLAARTRKAGSGPSEGHAQSESVARRPPRLRAGVPPEVPA